ncbi:MAG: glycosyltransferase family 2 protein [Desulfobacterales bacterium]|nr:glycosyltransferase family 2 protein [Desulfobacterales bacterium]
MDISFIILTWNSEKYIEKCLVSIFENTKNFPFEIFIVDNGSSDSTKKIIKSFILLYPDIIIPIFLDYNTGTTYSRNLALKRVSGKYIVMIDSDVEILENTIEKLITTLSKDYSIGIIAPKLLYPTGKLQKSTDYFPTLLTKIFRFFFLKLLEKKEQKQNEVDYAISAFWVMRKEIIEIVGLLDEKIFYAPEDVDFCLRIWQKGYKVVYLAEVKAIHDAQEISRKFIINKPVIDHIKGLFYLFMKHRYFLKKPDYK